MRQGGEGDEEQEMVLEEAEGLEGMAVLAAHAAAAPTDESLFMLQHAGGATRRGGGGGGGGGGRGDGGVEAGTAAGERGAFTPHDWEISLVIIALWTDPSAKAREAAERWADAAFEALRAYGAGLYAVDIDPFRRPGAAAEDELTHAFGAKNVRRLRALKRRVDPRSLFRATFPL